MMLRNFFFGNSDVKKNEEAAEIEDDQPRNKFNEIQILSGHTDLVDSLLNVGDLRVLSTGQDKRGIVWDCNTGEILYDLNGHSRVITSTFFLECYIEDDSFGISPVIVTASSDETIRVWDLSDGHCRKIVKQHEGTVKSFCLIPNEPMIIVSGGQDICVWDLSFELLYKLQRNSLDYVHTTIAITPHRIAAATDQPHLTIYSMIKESILSSPDELYEIKEFKKLPRHRKSISSLIRISDSMFASASMDGAILIWSSNHLDIIHQFNNYENYENIADHTYPYRVNHLIMADQRYVIAAIGAGFAIYDVQYDKCVCRVVKGHHSAVTCISLLSRGSYLATSSLDGTIRLWAAPMNQNFEDLSSQNDVLSISRLFGRKVLDVKSFPMKLELVGMCYAHSNSVKCIIECGSEGFISCGNDGLVIFWKDSEVLQKRCDEELHKVLSNIDWLVH